MASCFIKGIWVQYLSLWLGWWGFLPWTVLVFGVFFEDKLVLFESSPGRRSSLPRHTHLAARARGRACWPPRLPGAGTASPPAHQHQPALTCGNPAPSIAQTLLEWQLHWAGSSSFPVYYFVYQLHHSAMEKFKCFVTFHWEDSIKLKCLYHSAI